MLDIRYRKGIGENKMKNKHGDTEKTDARYMIQDVGQQ
jgi:hypothetical protein